jgi:SRSO17 transposase
VAGARTLVLSGDCAIAIALAVAGSLKHRHPNLHPPQARALAEAAGHASPYRMQHLLSRARVDERQLLDAAADWAAAHLTAGQDEDDVVLIVDETADEKSSAGSVAPPSRRYGAG